MNNHDKQLFIFFKDLHGIMYYKDSFNEGNDLQKIYNDVESILTKKTYSDINIQDEKGNTLIHYAIEAGNIPYIQKLLQLGINPHIINNDGLNAFKMHRKNYNFMSEFWKFYENVSFRDFITETQNYHLKFKQTIFETSLRHFLYHESIESIMPFLDACGLNSSDNAVKLFISSSNINTPLQVLNYITSLDRTPIHNSNILNYLATHLDTKSLGFNYSVKTSYINFIETSSFEYNFQFLNYLKTSSLLNPLKQNDFSSLFAMKLLTKIVEDKVDVNIIFKEGYRQFSFKEIFENNSFLNIIYMNLKLNSDLKNNADNLTIKKHKI